MRLIASKVYRAFPELDRFTDEQCHRFVAAVNRRPARRALRVLGVGVMLLLAVTVGFYIATRVLYRDDGLLKRWARPWWLMDVLQLTLPFLFAAFCGLVSRDVIIRFQIRTVIRIRGTCLKCGYSLLGIRVVENRVICPECGTPAEADAALGELVSRDGGGVIFHPVMTAEVAAKRERRRRRWRMIRRGVLVGTAVMLFAGAVGYTVWWYQVQRAAERASAARDVDKQLAAWQARNRPADVPADAVNSWEKFATIIARFNRTEKTAAANYFGLLSDMDESTGWIAWCYPTGTAEDWEPAMKGLAAHQKDRTADALAELAAARPLLLQRPIDAPPPNPLTASWNPELLGIHSCGFMCLAQAHIAMGRGDDQLAGSALKGASLCLEAIEQDPAVFAASVARELRLGIGAVILCDARQVRDPAVLRQMSDVADRMTRRMPIAEHLEAARCYSLDAIRWFYSEPLLVRRSTAIGPATAVMGAWAQRKSYRPSWVGSREAAEEEVNAMYDEAVRRSKLPAATRMTLPAIAATRPVVSTFVQDPIRFLNGEDEIDLLRRVRVVKLTLALEVFQREHGRYPGTLAELVPAHAAAEVLIDPQTNATFAYSPWDPAMAGPPAVTVGQPAGK